MSTIDKSARHPESAKQEPSLNGKPRSPEAIMAFEKAKALWLIERELGPRKTEKPD
jgi:hypothetical protein